jgi:hypothetical protein
VVSVPASGAAPLATVVEDVRLPHRFRLERRLGGFRLIRRWLNVPIALFTGLWCAIWDTVVVGGILDGSLPLLFWFTHGLPGAFVTYVLLCTLFNKTTIEVEAGVLSVRHGPLPWPRPPDLAARDVRQLVVHRKVGGKGAVTWDVVAEPASGKPVPLVKGLAEEQARLIERLVEDHLHKCAVPSAHVGAR